MNETTVNTATFPPEQPAYLPPKVVKTMQEALADGELPATIPVNTPNLTAALCHAQKKCRKAMHDQENTFHHFKYTSAEAVFEAAKEALADTGLAMIPLGARMATMGNGQFFSMEREITISHVSGESITTKIDWPVIPDKGRPLDKAFASAITTSLAYYLRDLLQMPRVDPQDDIAGRDDRQAKKQPSPKEEPVDQAMVDGWKAWLDKLPDRQKVNDNLKDLSSLKGATKRVCWEMTKTYGARYSWVFNKDTKQFDEPETHEGASA